MSNDHLNRVGKLTISFEMIGRLIGLPDGYSILDIYVSKWDGSCNLTITGPDMPTLKYGTPIEFVRLLARADETPMVGRPVYTRFEHSSAPEHLALIAPIPDVNPVP